MTSHVLLRLRAVEVAVRAEVARRRRADPHLDDPFRGLYLSDEAIDLVLAGARTPVARSPEPCDPASSLGRLAATAGLSELDVELLLVALAPAVDSRFEQLYGYLNDDVTRRHATVGLALRLCGLPEASAAGRARLGAGAPLLDAGLLTVGDPDRPLLSREVRVPDRVAAHLLGGAAVDAMLLGRVSLVDGLAPEGRPAPWLTGSASAGARLVYLRERAGLGAAGAAIESAVSGGILWVDPRRVTLDAPFAEALVREAVLRGAAVALGPIADGAAQPALDRLARAGVTVLAYGSAPWDPQWSDVVPAQLDVKPPLPAERMDRWRRELNGFAGDAGSAVGHLTLAPREIARAARAATLLAAASGEAVGERHLRAGARGQNASGLDRLAHRLVPEVGWDDLVLPPGVLGLLHELTARARPRDRVLDEWRMRPGGGRGRGVTALFTGESGTGKTMSAEVVAAALGLDLYTVNLATVVDKYVGETEKNLERIFTEAAGVNGVLLFDEADAIFGKRSEVRDAHDRYANVESAYLLQRMETFDGLAVLATNLRANLDEAFTRRLDVVVDFPLPDVPARRALWERSLGRYVPRSSDVDFDFLAESFELAGGHIRSAAVTAAYLAADGDHPVRMEDLVGAVAREYRKLGRLCLEREFGPYLALVQPD